MKNNMKKVFVLLSMLACVFSMTACANVSSSKTTSSKAISYDENTVKSSITSNLQSLSGYTVDQLSTMKDNSDEAVAALAKNWLNVRDELGSFVEITSCDFDATSTSLTVNAHCNYSNRTAVYTVSYSSDGKITSSSFTPDYSLGEKMQRAVLNTVIAICIVFIVLFFISILISAFAIIHKYQNKQESMDQNHNEVQAVHNTTTQNIQTDENEINDLELVAIITAAIAASENTSSDNFVVRSIRKINKSNWQKA